MIGHIQDLDTSLRVWECLERLYSTSTKAHRIQLKNELNNLTKSPSQNVNDFILKLKEISDALGSIGSILDDIDLVGHTLNALRGDDKWKSFTTLVYISRDSLPDFQQLTTLMLTRRSLTMVSTRPTEARIRYSLQEEEEAVEIEVAVEDNQEHATTMTTMTTKQVTTIINHQEEEAEDEQEGKEAGLAEEATTIPMCAMYAASQDTMPTTAINGIEDADMEEAEKQHEASQQESLEESGPCNNGSSSIKGKATLVEIDDDEVT
ncbi:hypothetical protein L7F22_011049 [Adiantum nelumboides]|nr:hypothetical protein [Adiantum nelumboides]